MLWNDEVQYLIDPFELESNLEESIIQVAIPLFGKNRIYLDTKKIIGKKGKTRNIPDGYLLDLESKKDPKLYVVENELAKHDPLKHIAVQILEFSLSFETSQHHVKNIVKNALLDNADSLIKCQQLELRCQVLQSSIYEFTRGRYVIARPDTPCVVVSAI